MRERAGQNSKLLVPDKFSTCHPVKIVSKTQTAKSTDLAFQTNTPEIILLLQEQCRQEWGSEFSKPVKVGTQDGQPIIKFQNHEADSNPSSYVLGDYRKLVIHGNHGPSGDLFLPEHMTAAEFIDFSARRCGAPKDSAVAWTSPAPAKFSAKTKGRSDFFAEILTMPFYEQSVLGDFIEIRNHQRKLLRQMVGLVRGGSGSYLIKSAEGFGKTSSHFSEIKADMLDIASA